MRRLNFAFALLGFLLAPAAVQAQTHPCDTTPPIPDVRPGVPFAVGFCHDKKDSEGNPTTIDTFKVAIDGTQVFNGALVEKGPANAAGLFYFETPKTLIVATKGTHTIVNIAGNSAGDSLPTSPLSFAAKELPPSPLSRSRIAK